MTARAAVVLLRQIADRKVLASPAELHSIADLIEGARCGWSENGICPMELDAARLADETRTAVDTDLERW